MAAKAKICLFIAAVSWLVPAFFTLVNLGRIWRRQCYFSSGWLFCDHNLSSQMSVILFLLILGILAGFIYYGVKNWQALSENEETIAPRIKIILSFLVLISAFLVVPFGSGDTSFYFSAGRAVNEGINPYVEQWRTSNAFGFPPIDGQTTGIMYGPVILYVFNAVYFLAGGNYVYFLIIWKLLMILLFILTGYLVFKAARAISPNFKRNNFYFFWLLQPLLLFEWISNGHFDAIWLIFLLLAILSAVKKKWWFVWAFLTLGVWIKFIPLIVAPWFVVWWWQDADSSWHLRLKSIVAGAGVVLAVSYAAWANFWTGTEVFKLIILQSKWAISSIFSVLYYSLLPLFKFIFSQDAHWFLTRAVHFILLIFVFYLLWPYFKKAFLTVIRRDKFVAAEIIKAIFLTLSVYLLVWQKSIWPWYLAWLLPLGLVTYLAAEDQMLKKILVWISASPFVFYLFWLSGYLVNKNDPAAKLWFFYAIVLFVVAYPLVNFLKWRRADFK